MTQKNNYNNPMTSNTLDPETIIQQQFTHWTVFDRFEASEQFHDLNIHLSGIAAKNTSDAVATGSAGSLIQAETHRAKFELLERMIITDAMETPSNSVPLLNNTLEIDGRNISIETLFPESPSPEHYQWSKSNGIALHTSLAKACESASLELVERDQVLASWYGASCPQFIETALINDISSKLEAFYMTVCVRFNDELAFANGKPVFVYGVFLLPRDNHHVLHMGFGAAFDEELGILKAKHELVQRLGFLSDAEPVEELVEVEPTPDFHLEYFLQAHTYGHIANWINGKFFQKEKKRTPSTENQIDYALIYGGNKNNTAATDFFVVKALSQNLIPLVFGNRDYSAYLDTARGTQIHPVS